MTFLVHCYIIILQTRPLHVGCPHLGVGGGGEKWTNADMGMEGGWGPGRYKSPLLLLLQTVTYQNFCIQRRNFIKIPNRVNRISTLEKCPHGQGVVGDHCKCADILCRNGHCYKHVSLRSWHPKYDQQWAHIFSHFTPPQI